MLEPSYEVKISNYAATCKYLDDMNCAEIIKMRGNFWKTHGYFHQGRNLLHPEESLYLLEKGNITIESSSQWDSVPDSSSSKSTTEEPVTSSKPESQLEEEATPSSTNQRVNFISFYEKIVGVVGLPYYLVYSKLKNFDYIVTRCSQQPVHFNTGQEMEDLLGLFSSSSNTAAGSLLQRCAAFRVYLKDPNWSKKQAASYAPLGYVIIITDEVLPPGPVLLQLLSEAAGVPLFLANVSSTYQVSIFEFVDAEVLFDLKAEPPFTLNDPTASMKGVQEYAQSKRKSKKRKQPPIDSISHPTTTNHSSKKKVQISDYPTTTAVAEIINKIISEVEKSLH